MIQTVTILTEVEVQVDLRKFSTEILVEEVRERGDAAASRQISEARDRNRRKIADSDAAQNEWVRIPPLGSKDSHPLHGIYYALKFGKKEHALDLMRDYLGDQFGVVL